MAIYSPIPLSREQDLDCFTSHAISPHLMGARFLPCPPIMQPTPLPSPPHIYFDKNYFDKFDLATHFFPEEPILKAPDLSDPLAAFLDKMNYKPHEIVLSNSTDLEQEISVQVSGYYLDSFQCSRFFKIRLLPGESKKFHEIADKDCMKFRIDFNNIAIKKINILNTTSSININEDSLTRAHCDLVIENFKKPLMPLPAYFKNGLEIPGLDVKFEEFLSADETPIHLKNFALKARNTYNQFIQGCNKFTPPSFSFLKLPIMTPDGFINYFTLPIQTLPPAIPKIVSFIWMGSPLPLKYYETLLSWRKHNPTYPIIVWTDITERKVNENINVQYFLKWCKLHNIKVLNYTSVFPKTATEKEAPMLLEREFQDAYDRRNYGMLANVLRYEILFRFGGIYADTDNPCYHPWDSFIKDVDSVMGLCPPLKFSETTFVPNNDTIAFTPFHPIMQESIRIVQQRHCQYYEKKGVSNINAGSCFVLQAAYLSQATLRDICFPPSVLHPSGKFSVTLPYLGQPSHQSVSGAYLDTTWIGTNPFKSYLHETDLEKCQRMARMAEVDTRRSLSNPDADFHLDLKNVQSNADEISLADLTIDRIIDNNADILNKLTRIDLTNSDISEDGFFKIAENFKNLEKLVLKNTNISIPVLEEILMTNPNIKILSLANCRNLQLSPRLWSTIIPYLKNLEELNLTNLKLSDELINSLQTSVFFTNLKKLNIRQTNISKDSDSITNIVKATPSLKIIKIDKDSSFSIQCYKLLLIKFFLQSPNKQEFLSSILEKLLEMKNRSSSTLSDEEVNRKFIDTLTYYARRESSLFFHLKETVENLSELAGFEFLQDPEIINLFQYFEADNFEMLKERIKIDPKYDSFL